MKLVNAYSKQCMNIVQGWINNNYEDIVQWARNASYNHHGAEDLAHDIIEKFMQHKKAELLVKKGQARFFITRMLLNQARSTSSPFNRNYRMRTGEHTPLLDAQHEEYDTDIDFKIETIRGICEDIKTESIEGYYCITIFEQLMQQKKAKVNFSRFSKDTGIPRTSISNAYTQAIQMIKDKLYGTNLD